MDRYRRGKRNLEAVCAEYGVVLDGAHEAAADAQAAVLVACAIAERHRAVAALSPGELHTLAGRVVRVVGGGLPGVPAPQGLTGRRRRPVWPLREPEAEMVAG